MQYFLTGIAQVYYVGLLAGTNNMALLQLSGVGRDINRHHFTRAEVEADLQRPVVQALLGLIRLRNTHPAFGSSFHVERGGADGQLAMRWEPGDRFVALAVDFDALTHALSVDHAMDRSGFGMAA